MGKAIYINQAAYVKDTLNLSGGTLTGIINYNGDLSNNFSGNTLITKDYTESITTSLETAISTEISTTDTEITSLSTALNNIDFSSLETEISTESSIRSSADTSLSTALSTEISTTNAEITSLSSEISTEISTTNTEITSLSTAIGNYSTTLDGLTDTSIDTPVSGNMLIYDTNSSKWINSNTINRDTTIIGDLYVSGTTITINASDMNVSDNIILVNSGETNAGVSLIYAGIEVDRGTLDNYRFVLDDTVTSNPLFKIGAIGDYQAVATRQDSPISSGVTYWNDASKRFDTSTGLIFDGTTLKYETTITLNNDVDIVHKNYVDTADLSLETALSNFSTTLSGLTDTTITNLQEGDVLIYSGGTWINDPGEDANNLYYNISDGVSLETALSTEISTTNSDVTSLSTAISTGDNSLSTAISTEISITDVEVTSLETAIGNFSTDLSGLTDTTITNLQEGDILIYSGGTWINNTTIADIIITGDLEVYNYYYMGDANTDGSWRWFINGDGDLEFQKRITGTWTYKSKMT